MAAVQTKNAETIARFYAAFAALDGAGMAACYAPEVRFQDPVFQLQGKDVSDLPPYKRDIVTG